VKIIFVNDCNGRTRHFTLAGWTRALLSVCFLGLPLGGGAYLGYLAGGANSDNLLTEKATQEWDKALEEQKELVNETQREAQSQLSAITLRMAELQARLVRLDALGERLTSMAKLDNGEFNFNQAPAIGGPETASIGDVYQPPKFFDVVEQLVDKISDREQQLDTLEALMTKSRLQDEVFVAGRPIIKGWMSSRYGRRTDPFSGKIAWHSGVDFAGKLGSDIIAVASGIVVESGEKAG